MRVARFAALVAMTLLSLSSASTSVAETPSLARHAPDAPATGAAPAGPVDPATVGIRLVPVATGLDQPDFVTGLPGGRLFIVEQHGRILLMRDGVMRAKPFLDITSRVICCAEQGLLGVAFHPDYDHPGTAGYGRFYVSYSDRSTLRYVLSEFRKQPGKVRVDPATERRLIALTKPYPYHYSGMLAFGPDGHLWVGMGDGGHPVGADAPGDPGNLAQSLGTRFGKILRIDPLDPDGAGPRRYAIPVDNPFLATPGARPEIWAYGLRNPWRFSFDRLTGDLWIGDVGHSFREEIDKARAQQSWGKGWNFGWRLLEGTRCYAPASDCDPGHITVPPRWEYIHNYSSGGEFNCAVAGGYVYRGSAQPLLSGRYLFGDYCSGRIWSLPAQGTGAAVQMRNTQAAISSFGQDADGELYVSDLAGTVWRIEAYLKPAP